MPNLFLIDGVPGSGKSDLIAHCSRNKWNSVFIKKYTTKKIDNDGFSRSDLEYVDEGTFNSLIQEEDFEYTYPKYSSNAGEVRYLISRNELDKALKEKKNVFVIVRSAECIKRIKETYSNYLNVDVISIYTYCDNDKLKNRTRKQLLKKDPNMHDDEISRYLEIRLSRNGECLQSYYNSLQSNSLIYDYVIINDLEQAKYYECIDNIVSKHIKINKRYNELTAFIIMPMPSRREAAHFENVKEAIKLGAERAGFKAKRSDDEFGKPGPIISKIKKTIENATVCIVDLTNNRPNCYFEAGLALEKSNNNIPAAFFIAEEGTEIEFDLNNNDCKKYTYSLGDYSSVTNVVQKILLGFKEKYIF